jgi:hypothetical protein
MVREGRQNGFEGEYGVMAFDYANTNSRYGEVFDQAMSSYSAVQTEVVVAALAEHDLSSVGTLCDVAGGHGHFACGFLNAYPHLSAIVFDRPEVVAQTDRLWARASAWRIGAAISAVTCSARFRRETHRSN